jgi:hypothetical protein
MRLKVRSSVLLPQPDGPMKAVTLLLGDVQVDALQRVELAVVEVQVFHRSWTLPDGQSGDGVHMSASSNFFARQYARQDVQAQHGQR